MFHGDWVKGKCHHRWLIGLRFELGSIIVVSYAFRSRPFYLLYVSGCRLARKQSPAVLFALSSRFFFGFAFVLKHRIEYVQWTKKLGRPSYSLSSLLANALQKWASHNSFTAVNSCGPFRLFFHRHLFFFCFFLGIYLYFSIALSQTLITHRWSLINSCACTSADFVF